MEDKIEYRMWDTEEKQFMSHSRVLESRVSDLENNGQERFIFQRYSGIKDKNKVKMFEGDIFKVWIPGMPNEYRTIQAVQFLRGYFGCAGYPLYLMDNSTMEVIGNIYENPELIEV